MKYYITLVGCCLLVLIGYWPGLDGPMIFDSGVAISENLKIRINELSFSSLYNAALSSDSGPLKRPVSMLSFALNYYFDNDLAPFWFKLTNVFVHLMNGLLLAFIATKLFRYLNQNTNICAFKAKWAGLLVATIWLFHPLQVSTVLYTVQRMTELSAFFVLIGVAYYLIKRERIKEQDSLNEFSKLASILMVIVVFAILSKENGVMLIWYVALLEMVVFRFIVEGKKVIFLQAIAWVIFLIPVGYLLFKFSIEPGVFERWYAGREFDVEERLFTQARLIWIYMGWVIIPNIRSMGFHHDDLAWSVSILEPITTLLSICALGLVIFLAWIYRKKTPLASFGVLWFLLGHALESSVLPLEMVYEHRNYLPIFGISLMVVQLFMIIVEKLNQDVMKYIPVVIVSALAGLLFIRASYWSNEMDLSAYNFKNHPESTRSAYHFANTNLRYSDSAEDLELKKSYLVTARDTYEKMYQNDQDDLAAIITLIYLDSRYFNNKDTEKWIAELMAAVDAKTLQSSDINAFSLLINCFSVGWCNQISENDFRLLMDRLIERRQHLRDIYFYLGRYYLEIEKNTSEAIKSLQMMKSIDSEYPRAYYLQSDFYVNQGLDGNALEVMKELSNSDRSYRELKHIESLLK